MISRWLVLVLCVVFVSPSLLRAQPRGGLPPGTAATAADSTNYDKMYEDIEILRRILDRKITPLYPSETRSRSVGMRTTPGLMANPNVNYQPAQFIPYSPQQLNLNFGFDQPAFQLGTNTTVIPIRSLEGVYLKGQGVVYTVTLSSLQPPAEAKAAKLVSEWESARRQVRNEKEEPKKAETSKPPTLSDVLLKVLAENGHHFSQLGENESLTLVITVHDKGQSTEAPKSKGGSAKKSSSSPKSGDGSDLPGKARDLELLGDLHQKRGHYEEAIKMFQEAMLRNHDPNTMPTLDRKLAQCHLALGQDEMAQRALDHIRSLLKKPQYAKAAPAPTAKPALPIKLIISAPKKLLDEAKGGKIPFEEFRRRARVETLGFGERRGHE